MDKFRLPTSVTINDIECEFDADYRNIIQVLIILNDPDLLEEERISCALNYFYRDNSYTTDIFQASKYMVEFISQEEMDSIKDSPNSKPLYDWEQDYNIIIAPINKVIGTDVRGLEFLHWWTFLSAFMEIGECTFSTYVGIRDKLNKGKKLEKYEERIYKENRDKIALKRKYDSVTQALMDEILGKG